MATQRSLPPRPAPAAPAPRTPYRPPRRGLWTFFCFSLFALALVGGEVGARTEPDLALSFRGKLVELHERRPDAMPSELPLQVAGGVAGFLVLLLIWQAGAAHRPLFWPLALVLLLACGAVGFYRGGRDLDLERSAARLPGLEKDLDALRKKLDAATGSLQKSGLDLKERDETLVRLRAELETLKAKLAEKDEPPK